MPTIVEQLVYEFTGNEAPLSAAFAKAEAKSKHHVSTVNTHLQGIGKSINIEEHFNKSAKQTEASAKSHAGRLNSIFEHVGEKLKGVGAGVLSVFGGGALLSAVQGGEQAIEKFADMGLEFAETWEKAELRMAGFTGSAEKGTDTLKQLLVLAQDRALEFKPLAAAAFNLTEFGYKGPQIVSMFSGITAQAVALGKGSEGVTRLVGMLDMMEDSGKAAARGLIQLERQGYQVFRTLSSITGLDKQFLSKALQKGKLDPKMAIGLITEGWEYQFGALAPQLTKTFSDQMVRATQIAGPQLATAMGPVIEGATHVVEDLNQVIQKVGPKFAEGISGLISGPINFVITSIDSLLNRLGLLSEASDKLGGSAKQLLQTPKSGGLQYSRESQFLQSPQQGVGKQFVGDGYEKYSSQIKRAGGAEFVEKVKKIAASIGIDPSWLMNVMAIESGGTFSPGIKNPNSSAIGLIQFTGQTPAKLGTSRESLGKMTAIEQLDYVEKYLAQFTGKLKSQADVYGAIFLPSHLGQDVYASRGSKEYAGNKGLDVGNKGVITANDLTIVAQRAGFSSGAGQGIDSSSSSVQQVVESSKQHLERLNVTIERLTASSAKWEEMKADKFEQVNRLRATLGYQGVGTESPIGTHLPIPGVLPKPEASSLGDQTKRQEMLRNLEKAEFDYQFYLTENSATTREINKLSLRRQQLERDQIFMTQEEIDKKKQWAATFEPDQFATQERKSEAFHSPIQYEPPKYNVRPIQVAQPEPSALEKSISSSRNLTSFERAAEERASLLTTAKQITPEVGALLLFHKALEKVERTTTNLSDSQQAAFDKVVLGKQLTDQEHQSVVAVISANQELNKAQKEALIASVDDTKSLKDHTEAFLGLIFKYESVRSQINKGLAEQGANLPTQIIADKASAVNDLPKNLASVAGDFLTKWDFTMQGAKTILIGGLKSVVLEPLSKIFQDYIQKEAVNLLQRFLSQKTQAILDKTTAAQQTAAGLTMNVAAGLQQAAADTMLTAAIIQAAGNIGKGATGGGGDAGKGATGGIVGYSTGTLKFPGGVGMVGEEGRELVHLPAGTHIYNNKETEAMLGARGRSGGGSTTINLTLNAPVLGGTSHETARSRREYMEMLAPALMGVLQDAA